MPLPNAVAVKKFIDHGASKPISITEFNDFWKTLTPEEKEQYGKEANTLLPAAA